MLASMYRIVMAVSFVGCLAVSVLWCRSYWTTDIYTYETDRDYDRKIRSDIGRVSFFRVTAYNDLDDESTWFSLKVNGDDVPSSVPLVPTGGFHYEYDEFIAPGTRDAFTRQLLIVPYWALAIALAALPVLTLRDTARRRFAKPELTIEPTTNPVGDTRAKG